MKQGHTSSYYSYIVSKMVPLLEVVVEINFIELSSIQLTGCIYYGLIFWINDDCLPNRLMFVSEMLYIFLNGRSDFS
jgi:hypothetical protein